MHDSFDKLPDLITIGQAARLLNVHIDTLRRWDRDGTLHSVRIGPTSQRRYQKSTILAARGMALDGSALHHITSKQLLIQMARLLRTVSSSLDSQTMALTVVDEAVRMVGATYSVLFLLDETREHFVSFASAVTKQPQLTQTSSYPQIIPLTAQPLFNELNSDDAIVCISDTFHDPRTTREFFAPYDIRGLIVAPLRTPQTPLLGILCLFWVGYPRAFTDEERIFAEALANQTAIGLENAQLHERLRHASEAAKSRAAQLTAIINSAPEGIIVYDNDDRIVLVNQKVADLYGIARSAMRGLTDAQFEEKVGSFCAQVTQLIPMTIQDELHQGERQILVQELGLSKPQPRTIQRFLTPVIDQTGAVLGKVAVYHDISEERALAQAKDKFMMVASHELRQPMTVLSGYAQLLVRTLQQYANGIESGETIETQKNLLDRIQSEAALVNEQAKRLNDLFNVLFDHSQIAARTLQIHRQPFLVQSLVQRCVRHVGLTTTRHTFQISSEGETNERISGDAQRIEQVLRNLLENAVKYTPDGGLITVHITRHNATATSPAEIWIAVHDKGIGVPLDQQRHLFDTFYRASNAPAATVGLGLGLALCAEIVNRHGGRIWVESAGENRGSTFVFTLPLEMSMVQE